MNPTTNALTLAKLDLILAKLDTFAARLDALTDQKLVTPTPTTSGMPDVVQAALMRAGLDQPRQVRIRMRTMAQSMLLDGEAPETVAAKIERGDRHTLELASL